ncbi:IS5 family transposase [Pelagicoccus sp. SDUM812002]|uniref:IS5 family transposase n=1 Tax=Pelagicoccus sp. SDUM812002 TaxID=3041266 RepID=UPI00280E598D|nr:IS5 family transposase [Pelagicoccus sp. SDUM812002]MDQ8188475.1 IS5 family transposase [Pelagicoccus sp. SDUM812002]
MRFLYPYNHVSKQGRLNALGDSRGAKKINNAHREEVSGRRGRPHAKLDSTLDGIWWILCTGAMWNQLPERYGKHNSVWRCYRRWCGSGLWDWALERLALRHRDYSVAVMLDATHVKAHQDACRHSLDAEDQKLGKTKGGRNSKLSAAVNTVGLALSLKLVCGNENDCTCAVDTLEGHVDGNLVLADKAYDTNAIRAYIQGLGGVAVIPPKANRKDPPEYHSGIGKLRHRVENFFCRIKRYRRIATRYDKLPVTYMGFVTLCSLIEWIKFDFVHTA